MAGTEANSINASTIGIVGNTGTSFTATAATAHNVIIGGSTSSTLTNVAPSATSGVPLISQGASADPTFGTAVVAGGGTGDTSLTAYAVLCGGTTSTGAVQSIASVGTSGQFLTSNGAGALPTMQTVSTAFTPNSVIQIYDDFIGADFIANTSANDVLVTGAGSWFYGSTSLPNGVNGTAANPGLINNNTLGAGANFSISKQGKNGSNPPFVLGGGAMNVNWVMNIATLSNSTNRYIIYMGLMGGATSGLGTDGVFFEYSDNVNSGKWLLNCTSASTNTNADSGNTATTSGYHNFGLQINAAASSVTFTIDGSSVGTIATNIPTAVVSPYFSMIQTAGTVAISSVFVDLFYLTQTLTSGR